MIFNFTKDYQFSADIKLKKETLVTVTEIKLLGVYISDDLKWNRNTEEIVKKANQRMRLLNAASKFTSKISDLRTIYKMFVRSVLEYSSVVWHSSLSGLNSKDIERIQKAACKVILKDQYVDYESALKYLNLDKLEVRRKKLCLNFAKNTVKNAKVKSMFPFSKSKRITRNSDKFLVNFGNTERYKKSAIPYLQNLLNDEEKFKNSFIRCKGL